MCMMPALAETTVTPAPEVTVEPAPIPAAQGINLTELVVAALCFLLGLLTTLVTGTVQKHFNKNKLTEQYNDLWKAVEDKLTQAGLTVDRAAIEAALKQMGDAALKELAKAFENKDE